MPRRKKLEFRWLVLLCVATVGIVVVAMLSPIGNADTLSESKVYCPPILLPDPIEPADVISATEPFVVPDGTPEELLQLIRQKSGSGMDVPSRQQPEKVAAYVALFREFKAIADEALNRQPTDAVRKELLQTKAEAYAEIAGYEPDVYPEYEAFVREVEANPNNREAAIHVRGRHLDFLGHQFYRKTLFLKEELDEAEFRNYQKLVLEFLNNKEAEPFLQMLGMSLVSHSLTLSDQMKDRSIALETAAAVKKLFENAGDEFNRSLAYRIDGTLNKHWAPEDGLKVKGIQSDGKEFDLASLKGKSVLLILWSNRQVPFERGRTRLEIDLPHLTELYEKYHSQGLEIVDICIDTKVRGPMEGFIGMMSPSAYKEAQKQQESADRQGEIDWEKKVQTFPWSIHLFPQKNVETGRLSIMEQYDLFGDHQFLLAPDGKVVVSKMGGTYNEEVVKRRVSGLTWKPGMMPQPWEDRFSTLEFEEELEKMFPTAPQNKKYTLRNSPQIKVANVSCHFDRSGAKGEMMELFAGSSYQLNRLQKFDAPAALAWQQQDDSHAPFFAL